MPKSLEYFKLCDIKPTHLPTNDAAHYYGREDGNVYVIYGVFDKTKAGKVKLEFRLERLDNCSINGALEVFKNNKEIRKNLDGEYLELDFPDVKRTFIDKTKGLDKDFVSLTSIEIVLFKSKNLPLIRTT